MSLDEKLSAWQEHYDCLLNEEFTWDPEILSNKLPVQGPAIEIATEMVLTAISKMKCGKAAGPSGIIIEMIKVAGDKNAEELTVLVNRIVAEGIVPSDWNISFIINLFEGKGDSLLGVTIEA